MWQRSEVQILLYLKCGDTLHITLPPRLVSRDEVLLVGP